MTHALDALLDQFRELSDDERTKGNHFERLIKRYLQTDPQYSSILSDVWLWDEWSSASRWGNDDGIDIVAREEATGNYWAIQCKFYDGSHAIQKSDIDSFFTASGKQFPTDEKTLSFSYRLIVSTTDKWSSKAEKALENQTIPVARLGIRDLAEAPIEWEQFSIGNLDDISLKKKYDPRPHQREAIDSVKGGFATADRGKLIMACGTGKTFTALRLMEEYVPENGRVLFLAPSISLVSQTLREWTAQGMNPIHAFVVCSDSKVGKDEEDIRTHDLAYPATTDPVKLAAHVGKVSQDRRTVIFSTYQSIQVVSDTQRQAAFGEFDLIICDEAHRTTGLTLPKQDNSAFTKVHEDHVVRSKKRLYMTATPRIYADKSKSKAAEKDAVLYSMDDEDTFGDEFYRLGFGKAVEKDLLTEYKVLIVAVQEDEMAGLANEYNNAYKLDDKKGIDIRFATKIIGSWKGLSKKDLVTVGEDGQEESLDDGNPMLRAVAFSQSIKNSKQTTEVFDQLTEMFLESLSAEDQENSGMVNCTLDHVDGTMNSQTRQSLLSWLKDNPGENQCRILSNARCLSEGIDVPSLDAVIFFDTRDSIVDIVQSVGRVMRKAEGKEYGYIILPVGIPSSEVKNYNQYIDSNPQFKGIWKVIKALRAHDESLVDEAEFRNKIKVVTGGTAGGSGGGSGDDQIEIKLPDLPIGELSDAVYAAIPKKLGDREYWSDWAKSVADIADKLIQRIRELIKQPHAQAEFNQFLKGLQDTLNPAVTADEAIEMLAQHILTLPVFQALFGESNFPDENAVGKALQSMVNTLDAHAIGSETNELDKFYDNIRERVSLAKSEKSRQDVIRNLYDTFFKSAFPHMAERLGIVYTPVEVVDFIVQSVEVALKRHFNSSLNDEGVQVIDPFTGTGTFITRLLQSGLIDSDKLPYKFANELHANEIVLLAYYIASINIESAYQALTGEYKPFNGIVFTDTFQMMEEGDLVDKVVLPENNKRIEHQLVQDIRVIIGNPPYSAGQKSANDNNQNLKYDTLDNRIRDTYAEYSTATLKNSLYASEIRAIRWASDRIKEKGIIAFVTNGSFIDGNSADGLRKCLVDEFSYLYVFNLRGNQRGSNWKQEGGKIFDSGSQNTIAIVILIKEPDNKTTNKINYYEFEDCLSREEKLSIIENFIHINSVQWNDIKPNNEGDWINQRDPIFDTFFEMGNKKNKTVNTIFSIYSSGVKTNRDNWIYNSSVDTTASNMKSMISVYNSEVERYKIAVKESGYTGKPEDFIDFNPKRISWDGSLYPLIKSYRSGVFAKSNITQAIYRPYFKQWSYFDQMFNNRVYQMHHIFPAKGYNNLVICATGTGAIKPFSALISRFLPDLEVISKSQCFPLYWYEKAEEDEQQPQAGLFDTSEQPAEHGYIKREAITDWALQSFQTEYNDTTITKEDIFFYVYGILHSPEYKERFAADLKKMLPRIPFADDFRTFSDAGKELANLHLDYETVEPYRGLKIEKKRMVMEDDDYRVEKMVFGKKSGGKDKTSIIYNPHLSIHKIPEEAYEYVVNGKSAIEWIMERYKVTVDTKKSGIRNDPNDWSDDPKYIFELVQRIVTVSLETMKIVNALPKLGK